MNQELARCRQADTPLELVLDLGRQPLGNGFLSEDDLTSEYFYHLRCGFSEDSRLFQLIDQPAPEMMFHHDYAFFSGTSKTMRAHFAQFAGQVLAKGFIHEENPFIVELGSNDGIFLRHFLDRGIPHLGVEPSGAVAEAAQELGIQVLQEFFSTTVAQRIVSEWGQADVVAAANVMCHIPDIKDIAQAVQILLKPDGVLVFEDPYLGDVLQLCSYDQIYDEHVFLFSAMSVKRIFEQVGLELIDVEAQSTHGGSMRYTLAKSDKFQVKPSVPRLLAKEQERGLHLTETYVAFADRVLRSSAQLRETLVQMRNEGRSVAAYGATSKSTTVYNYAGIDEALISYVCDSTPGKIGKFTPGVHIPVVSENHFATDPPNVAFLAAWNHERELRERNRQFEESGGKWLTHVPKVRFLD